MFEKHGNTAILPEVMTEATNTAELIEPKMRRPSLSADYLPRTRLVAELAANGSVPVVLITGPAGYGKTTLLSAWLESLDWPAMWVTLDEGDNNVRTFVQYIVAVIQRQFPGTMSKTALLLSSITLPEGPVLTCVLVNELDELDAPFVLALDDYHAITNPQVHHLVAQILRHQPHALHLAICARFDPPLPLSGMRAKGQLTEVRMESLRFNREESAIFLKQLARVELPATSVANVAEQVDGWAAGLRVAALSLRHNPNVLIDKPQAMPASIDLMQYLFDEVLSRAPAPIQDFLVRTSILDTLSPALCEAVAGPQRARHERESCLDYIARNGLFVTPIDAGAKVYRYHHLFRKLLQDQLHARLDEEKIATLYNRASDWHAQHDQPDEALHYALAQKNYSRATRIIGRFRHRLMNNDEWQRLEHWVNQFPREVIASTASLVVAQACIAYTRFRRDECIAFIRQAEALIEALPSSPERDALRGEIAALLAHHHLLYEVDFAKTEAYADLALKLTPKDYWNATVLGWLLLSGVKIIAGDNAGAFETAYRSLAAGQDQGVGFRVHLLAHLCFIHAYMGDLSGLLRLTSELLKHDNAAGAPPGRWATQLNWVRYHKGIAHYGRNELVEAETCLSVVISQRYQAHVHCAMQSMFIMALTQQALGRPEAACELAEMAAQFALEMRCTTLLPATQVFQAQLALQQGRVQDAIHLLADHELPATLPPAMFFYKPFLTLAAGRLAEGTKASLATAETMLARLHGYAGQTHNPPVLMDVLVLESLLADARGDSRAALSTLEQALMLAQSEGFVRVFADKGARLAGLLARLHSKKVSPAFVQRIQDAFAQPTPKKPATIVLVEPLTEREQEVLALLQKRMSAKEIAAALYITPGTVKRHTHIIFQKLDVHSRREAVLKGEDLKLLPLQ